MPSRQIEAVLEVGHGGSISLDEGAGAVVFNVPALDSPNTALDAGLQTTINASALAGTYTVARNATTGKVTIARTDPGTFSLALSAAARDLLGFQSATYAAASSRTGEVRSAYILDCLGVELAEPRALQLVKAEPVRHGRVESSVWGRGRTWRAKAWVKDEKLPSSLVWFSGRVRLLPESTTTPVSETNLGGTVTAIVQQAEWSTLQETVTQWSATVVEVS